MQLLCFGSFVAFISFSYAHPQNGYNYERNNPGTNFNNIFHRSNDFNNNNDNLLKDTILPSNHKNSELITNSNISSDINNSNFFNLGTALKSNNNNDDNNNNNNNNRNIFNPGTILNNNNSNRFPTSGDKYLPPAAITAEPLITKQFYLVSAPEDTEETTRMRHFVIGRPQKNYRVVFIKAPTTDSANVRLTAEYAPQEEKTVIYVLSKKSNEVNIGDIATPAPTQPSKPEIFFIKYKTNEEAKAAQKDIQEQYDHLGGTSEFVDEGVLPVKSVIGSLDGIAENGGYDYKRFRKSPTNFFY